MNSRTFTYSSALFRQLLATATLFGLATQAHAVCYVDASAGGRNNGVSWDDAYSNLQFALLDKTCSEVWVAKGVYTPSVVAPDPDVSFEVPSGVTLYGGFRGGETDLTARDPKANLTILSGDIDHNDAVSPSNSIDWSASNIVGTNAYLVVEVDPGSELTVLDGFVITGGDQKSDPSHRYNSGGVACWSESFTTCRIALVNDIIAGNTQGGFSRDAYGSPTTGGPTFTVISDSAFVGNSGGAIFLLDAATNQTTIRRVSFVDNHSTGYSGAITLNESGLATIFPTSSFVSISQSTFSGNSGGDGGAINLECIGANAQVAIENSTFANNSAARGGAIFSEIHSSLGDSDPKYQCTGDVAINNATFNGNASGVGGAIYYAYGNLGSSVGPSIKNTILWNDRGCSSCGPEIEINMVGPTISDSIISGGCPSGSTCTNVSSSDPLLTTLGDFGGSTPTLLPRAGSAAIDAGNDSSCAPVDQRNIARPQNAHCDIGAVEWVLSDDTIFKNGFEP